MCSVFIGPSGALRLKEIRRWNAKDIDVCTRLAIYSLRRAKGM